MRTTFVLIFVLSVFIISLHAQSMLSTGNEWTYTYQIILSNSKQDYVPQVVSVVGDTILNSKTYKKVSFLYSGPCGIHDRIELLNEDSGKVYKYDKESNSDFLIYDFQEENAYVIKHRNDFNEIDSTLIVIDSTKQVSFGPSNFEKQYISICYPNLDDGTFPSCYQNEIIKYVGAEYFFIQDIEMLCDPSSFFIGLRCFKTDSLEINFTQSNCDTNYTSIQVSAKDYAKSKIHVYPNPTSGFLNIESDQKYNSISIVDINGKEIYKVNKSERIDISEFPNGIYLVKIDGSENFELKKIYKISSP